jgi:hypothetical protein
MTINRSTSAPSGISEYNKLGNLRCWLYLGPRQESHGNYLPLHDEERGRVYKEGLRRASRIEDHAL